MSTPTQAHWGWIALGLGSVLVISALGYVLWRRDRIDLAVFDSPDAPGSGQCIDPQLFALLKQLRRKTGFPLFRWINSGVRTPYWNQKVGGVSNSAHLDRYCMAVDIGVPNLRIRDQLVFAAKEIGFTRIGVANTFVHLDVDPTKKQGVAWGYPSGSPPPVNPFA